MHQGSRNMPLLNGRIQIFFLPVAYAFYEVSEVIASALAVTSGLSVVAEHNLIARRIFVARGQVPVGSIKDVADRIVVAEETLDSWGQASASDASLVVSNPMADLKLQHFPLAVRQVEFKDTVQRVRCLLIVIEHEMSAHGSDAARKLDAQSPAGNIDLVDALITQIPVARIPIPVPLVMKAIARERLQGSRSRPKIVVDAGGDGFFGRVSDRVAPFEAQSASQVHFTDDALA